MGPPSPADLTAYSAIQLFIQRATQVQPRLEASEEALTVIAQICRQVAGMPLAIELAAASVRMLPVTDIERQIRSNLDFLATTQRDVPARHRSIRAVFDHSWELLSAPEQALLSHLAVFRGGFTAEAATQVAGATRAALAALIDKSLLRQSGAEPGSTIDRHALLVAIESRFVLLEPIREYALEQLVARGEAAALQRAHAAYYLGLAEAASAQWDTPQLESAYALLAREHDNLRTALQWARDGGDHTLGLQLAGALWRFWRGYGAINEGRAWLAELLALDDPTASPPIQAARLRALNGAAWLASDQHDFAYATQLFEQSLALRRALGQIEDETNLLLNAARQARASGHYQRATTLLEDSLARHRALNDRGSSGSGGLGLSLYELALVRREQSDFAQAAALYDECVQLHREIGDREGLASALLGLGDVARDQGDVRGVQKYSEPSLALFRELGVQWAIGFALNNLALAAYLESDLTGACVLVDESVALFRVLKDDSGLAEVLVTSGKILLAQGDSAAAYQALTESLRLALRLGPRLVVAFALEGLASVMVAGRQSQLAVQLLGAASVLRAQMGTPMRPADQATIDQTRAVSRAALGDATFAALWAAALALPLEQLLSTVLGKPWPHAVV